MNEIKYLLIACVVLISAGMYGMWEHLPDALFNKYSWQARDMIIWRSMVVFGAMGVVFSLYVLYKERTKN